MKKIYSVLGFLMLMSLALSAQTKIYAPTLKAPENGKINQMPDVVLDWQAVTGITLDITYEAQLASNIDFSDAVTFPQTDLTSVQTSDLIFGQHYYWRVRAFDQNDPSDWSQTFSFQVVWTVSLRSQPSDGAIVDSDPEITWNPITGITKYQFQIDTEYAWHTVASGVSTSLNSSYVLNEGDIWAVGDGGIILHYDGTSWTSSESGVTEDLKDVYFVDATHGYVVGTSGTILFYDGSSWTTQSSGINSDLLGVSFADADKGVAVGAGGKIVVYNTGIWSETTSSIETDIYDVAMVSENNIWACGLSKKVLHFDGTTWTNQVVGTKDFYAISFQDDNTGWIVGKGGTIYHYDGAAWIEENSNTNNDLYSVSTYDYKGYAVGKSGTILALDGGWAAVSSGTTKALQGVSVLGSYGVIVGASGTILLKTDEGFNGPALKTITLSSDITAYKLSNLLYDQTYYYHVRAIHNGDTSAWSQVKSMTTKATVTLVKPTNQMVTDLLILFEWSKYEGTMEYIIEVDDNSNFTNPSLFYSDSNSIYLISSYFGTEYFWRVAAKNAFDISDWSTPFSFTTKNSTTLLTPADGQIDVSSCPKFTWTEIIGSPEYELLISKTSDFTDPLSAIAQTPFLQCAAQMEKNTVFYWKVRGVTLLDSSNWSPVWSFKTEGYIGIDEYLNSEAVSIYPNPNSGDFTLSLESYSSDEYGIKVIDIAGRSIYINTITCLPGANQLNISLPNIQQGMYTLMISRGDESITQKMLVK